MKTKEQCEKALAGRKQKIERLEETLKKFAFWKKAAEEMDEKKLYVEVCKDIEKTERELELVQAEADILSTVLEI